MKRFFLAIPIAICGSVAYSQTSQTLMDPFGDGSFVLMSPDLSFGMVNMSQSDELSVNGPSFGLGVAAQIGTIKDTPVYLEWNSTLTRGTSSRSDIRSQGLDPLIVSAGSSPVGTLDLATFVDATGASADATAEITDSSGNSALIISSAFSPALPGNATSQFALSQTLTGGIYTALSTNGETGVAAAYGMIFDDTGFLFVGTGDNTGTTIRSSYSDKVTYVDHSLFFSAGFPLDDKWTLTPKIGPVYRRFDRTSQAFTIVDINEGFELAPSVPDINLSETTSLNSNYFGAVLGATLSGKIRDDWQVNIGAEAGLARFKADADSSENVRVASIDTRIPGQRMTLDGTSGIGRISAGFTHVRPNNAIFSVSAFVDYMSDVPYVSAQTVTEPTVAVAGSGVVFDGAGETYRTHTIKKTKMISSGISFSIVFLF